MEWRKGLEGGRLYEVCARSAVVAIARVFWEMSLESFSILGVKSRSQRLEA